MKSKITTGINDRPKDSTVAQTGQGLPDESGKDSIHASDEEVERVRKKLLGENAHDELVKEVDQDVELPLKGSA